MAVGSHRDAFKAHQLVKKLIGKNPDAVLARLAAEILLNFVINGRQVIPDSVMENLPHDSTGYDETKLDSALEAVEGLCKKCEENHVNACFVNHARRILIGAKTGADLGSDFDGKKRLSDLIRDAEVLATQSASSDQKNKRYVQNKLPDNENIPESYEDLKRKYEELREKDVFRETLIQEIVGTIRSVSQGNFETEMPVHDDPQLGQLATAFNIMLGTISKTMDNLDKLVAERTAELNQSNQSLQSYLRQLNETNIRLNKTLKDVEAANRHITDSIQYARMIQSSLLPNPENIRSFLPDSFFIWMPRDIVSGDFIFTDYVRDGFVIAVIDCTGHGVPGAFMTLIASFGLRKIIRDEGWTDPAQILKRLSFIVKTTLHQDTDYALSDDGLDAAICFVRGEGLEVRGQGEQGTAVGLVEETDQNEEQTERGEVIFAGARLPLFYVDNGKIRVIKGDRQSIGYKKSKLNFNFTNHKVSVREGISFYMTTDGFTDQLGGKRQRKFGPKRFRNLLKDNAHLPFEVQRNALLHRFDEYKGENETQDDVTVVGFGF